MITKDTLEGFFADTRRLKAEGRAKFDIDGECRWSFFFIDADSERLITVAQRLEADGYEYIGLLEPAPDDDDQETIYLRCDRIETHTVDSLDRRNADLYALASEMGISDYDGMDVGAADGP